MSLSWLRGISVSENLNSHAQYGFSTQVRSRCSLPIRDLNGGIKAAEIRGYNPKPNDGFGSRREELKVSEISSAVPSEPEVGNDLDHFRVGPRTDSCTAANGIAIESVRRRVALFGRLALTVAQNLGAAAEPIHDYGRDEFDTC